MSFPLGNKTNWIKRPGFGQTEMVYYHKRTGRLYQNILTELQDGIEIPYCNSKFLSNAPYRVYFDFTYRCNLECKHCITSSSPSIDTNGELSTSQILQLISEIANIGVLELVTSGGEPFAHPDWKTIFQHIITSGMNLIITTNGLLLLKPNIIEALKQINPLEIRVSFDGGAKLHEKVRGAKTYSKALLGLGALINNGLNATAKLTLCRGGNTEFSALFEDLAKIKVPRIKVTVVKGFGRASTDIGNHLLGFMADQPIAENLKKLGKKFDIEVQLSSDDFPISVYDANDPKLRNFQQSNCGAGFETCYISPKGQMLACVTMPHMEFGNIYEEGFLNVWQSKTAYNYRHKAQKCKKWKLCDGLCLNV